MFRFLLSSASIFVLVSAMIPPQVIACGERMPITLLALYRGSDSIYVGRYEKTEDGEPTEDTADYKVIPIKKYFTISSALKGEPRKLLTLDDTEYRYKNQEVAADESEHSEDESESEDVKPGDSVLLFLKKGEETEVPELTDFSDGIKKMTPDRLAAYEARIRELNGIFAGEKPKYSQLVDWMIRSAEDPLTRWEGTFELLQSFQNMDWQAEQAKQTSAKPAEPEASESESEEYEEEAPKEFDTGDPNFAKNVSESQKLALTNILLSRKRPAKSEDQEAVSSTVNGDSELIELVKRWGDSRVAAHLIEQLRQDSSDTTVNAELMASIVAILHDDPLAGVSEEYSNIQWESEELEVAGAEQPAAEPVAAAESSGEQAPAVAVEEAEAPSPGDVASESNEEPAKKKTYGELRTELLTKFLSRADKVIAREQNKANAKALSAH